MKKNEVQTVLSKEQFREFYTYLNIIKPYFIDFCVVNGQFRSRTRSNVALFEVYFEYLKGMEFIIANIQSSVKMLSILSKKTKITVKTDDQNIYFCDSYQSLKMNRCPVEYCDNPFVTESELNDIVYKHIDNNKILVQYLLPKAIVSNIKKISDELGTETIKFRPIDGNPNKGCLAVSSQPSDTAREYIFEIKKNQLTAMDKDHYFCFPNIPYVFNKSDMALDFRLALDQKILLIIHRTTIDNLSIVIYCRTAYQKDDGE